MCSRHSVAINAQSSKLTRRVTIRPRAIKQSSNQSERIAQPGVNYDPGCAKMRAVDSARRSRRSKPADRRRFDCLRKNLFPFMSICGPCFCRPAFAGRTPLRFEPVICGPILILTLWAPNRTIPDRSWRNIGSGSKGPPDLLRCNGLQQIEICPRRCGGYRENRDGWTDQQSFANLGRRDNQGRMSASCSSGARSSCGLLIVFCHD
jgi:hypothetical protein